MNIFLASLFFFFSNMHHNSVKVETKLSTGWYYIIDENNGEKRQLDKATDYYFIDPGPIVIAKNIEKIELRLNREKKTYIFMQFDSSGIKAWSNATARSIGKRLGFILNDKLIQVARVNAEITAGISVIWDGYDKSEMELIKAEIEKNKNE